MNTNITLSLDTRRAKKDGTFPLIMRLGHNARTTTIPTGISLKESDWNEKARKVKSTYQGVSTVNRLNNQLQKLKADAMDIVLKLQEDGHLQNMAVTELRDKIAQQGASQSFFQYATLQVEELKKAGRIGTARSYHGLISVLKTFNGDKDLSFPQITFQFLTKFETDHIAKGNSYNGLSVYVRAIRAIFNKAIKSGIVEKELYPFNDYKIKSTPTEKRALDWQQLKKILDVKLEPKDKLFNARNYFLASYMMYGMNYTDMAFLKRADIVNGRVHYRRRKTAKLYDIKIIPQLEQIFSHYLSHDPDSEYVFPIIKRDNLAMQYKDIQWARKRYNQRLKQLAERCGIENDMTSYVSRHSFATQAMLQEVPLNAISAMLGHSSIKTTEIYLKSLPTDKLDEYNSAIIGD